MSNGICWFPFGLISVSAFGSCSISSLTNYPSLFVHLCLPLQSLLSLLLCLIHPSQGADLPCYPALLLQGLHLCAPPSKNPFTYHQLTIGRARIAGIVQIMTQQMIPTSSGNTNTSFSLQGYPLPFLFLSSSTHSISLSTPFRLSTLFQLTYSLPLLVLFLLLTCSTKLPAM